MRSVVGINSYLAVLLRYTESFVCDTHPIPEYKSDLRCYKQLWSVHAVLWNSHVTSCAAPGIVIM